MASEYCGVGRSADEACIAFNAGTFTESVHCTLPVVLNWETDTAETLPADTQAYDIVNSTFAVDSLHYIWLLVVFVGCATAAHPLLLIEQSQQPTMDTVLTAAGVTTAWSIWGRLVDGKLENYTQ